MIEDIVGAFADTFPEVDEDVCYPNEVAEMGSETQDAVESLLERLERLEDAGGAYKGIEDDRGALEHMYARISNLYEEFDKGSITEENAVRELESMQERLVNLEKKIGMHDAPLRN